MPTVELSYRGGHRRDGERFYIDRLLPEIWIPDHDLPLVTVEDPDLGPVETFASRRFRRRISRWAGASMRWAPSSPRKR